MHREHIQIALDQIAFVLAGHLVLREPDAVKRLVLYVDVRLLGVHILGVWLSLFLGLQCPGPERDNPSTHRMDREHHAVIEPVVQPVVRIVCGTQTCLKEIFILVPGRFRRICQGMPARRGPAETIFLNRGIFQASAPEIGITDGSALLRLQAVLEELLGIIHHQKQTLIALPCGNLFRRIFLFLYLDTVFPRKIFQCLHIRHAFMFHHEADSRA